MKTPIKKQGVYFLANNKVFELVTAFLNSFRTYNKELPLCLIPYNEDFDKVEAMKKIYDFSVFNNQELLRYCDDISLKFHGEVVGAYRKLVAWEGEFEQFIYIDIDTVVLDSLSFVWQNLSHCKIFTSHSNLPEIRRWVWKDSIYTKNKLNKTQIEYATNTGFIVSTKNILPMNWVMDQVEGALSLKEDMELLCMEQPFLNYLIVTSGYNYGSLFVFNMWGGTITKNIKLECWAGFPGGIVKDGTFKDPYKRSVFLMHWAGVWREKNGDLAKIPYVELWDYYRNLDPLNLPDPLKEIQRKGYSKVIETLRKISNYNLKKTV
ncbi:hypothetical protein [Flavobacterium sp. HJJ]|uniref:hypothetical protein n=1 Tax=Flavobacterium sp. HJJ TaxID=2783792 RepID=UPI00188A2BFB|nr:hypothetical protein [Flavobacterium sp. HJJ]MBF4472432.1 hypothetical protein [Flavobacterium sp. HJJ]